MIAPCVAVSRRAATVFGESGCLGVQPKVGGKLHLKPNNGTRPIANKYHEGKVKSTLEKGRENRWEGRRIHTFAAYAMLKPLVLLV